MTAILPAITSHNDHSAGTVSCQLSCQFAAKEAISKASSSHHTGSALSHHTRPAFLLQAIHWGRITRRLEFILLSLFLPYCGHISKASLSHHTRPAFLLQAIHWGRITRRLEFILLSLFLPYCGHISKASLSHHTRPAFLLQAITLREDSQAFGIYFIVTFSAILWLYLQGQFEPSY